MSSETEKRRKGPRFELLGPLEVHDELDRLVPVPAPKQRGVLAALVVDAGTVVSVDRLADLLWDGRPPRSARKTLENYFSRLRKLLGPVLGARILTRSPGYMIDMRDDLEIDLLTMVDLDARARAAAAGADWPLVSQQATAALALWRGDPFCDVPVERLRHEQSPQLTETRLRLRELVLTAEVMLGNHDAALPGLRILVNETQIRERPWELLMLTLFRSGRKAEAFEAYQRVRRILAEELGADPGRELQRLHALMLDDDPRMSIVPAEPLRLPVPATIAQRHAVPRDCAGRNVEIPNPRRRRRMNIDEMVLVSIDDHVVEPPDMFDGHVPAKWADQTPRIVTDENGADRWVYRGRTTGVSGLNAVVSWPPDEWGADPASFAEMRPAVYDVHARVRDMDRNGIIASMCFPTFPGFSAGHLNHVRDEVTVVMVQAYNDWHIDEWAGQYPGRFIPLALLPTWDPELASAEIRRVAAKGCRAVSLPELPHLEGLPSYHDLAFWGPVFETLSDNNVVMCLHIGQGFHSITSAPDAPIDNLIMLSSQVTVIAVQDLLWGPAMRTYPDLKLAWSEGGIGWVPFYLDRCDRHYTNQRWLRRDFGGRLPSEVFREHSLACYITDPTSLKLRHEIGIDTIAWECDYPHSDSIWPNAPERVFEELVNAGASDEDIDKITWRNAARFFDWDPFAVVPRQKATVGALRASATDVDTSIRSRKEWARLYAEQQEDGSAARVGLNGRAAGKNVP
jgi:DNA-binding SARP family transcriptional activator/predicted TIM-barrel fold metal-dependent hydrolase